MCGFLHQVTPLRTQILFGIARRVRALHAVGWVHRALHPRAFVRDGNGTAWLLTSYEHACAAGARALHGAFKRRTCIARP